MSEKNGIERPDWVDETPEEPTYDLSMWDPGGSEEQSIPITRKEFIALKQHLAELRGYVRPVSVE